MLILGGTRAALAPAPTRGPQARRREVIGYLREHEITLTWNPAAAALQARATRLPRPSL